MLAVTRWARNGLRVPGRDCEDSTVRELTVETTADPHRALSGAESYLMARPVEHNVLLTLLGERVAEPEPGRYWIVWGGHEVVGFAMQSPATMPLLLSPMPGKVIEALADEVAASSSSLPGCAGEVSAAALFAGRWSELVPEPVSTEEGQRLYRLATVRAAPQVPGTFRLAGPDDHDVLVRYRAEFCAETGAFGGDPGTMVRAETAASRLFVWDDGGVVSTARVTAGVAGVARIGFVYTPGESRGRGYAAACVGALSARVRDVDGLECILFTQLANPTSNRLYRALGYEAIAERLSYRFGKGH